MPNKIKNNNITLYSIHVPLLLISLILLGAGVNTVVNRDANKNVLSEEDSRDSEDSEDTEDESKDEDKEDENKEEQNREAAKKEAEKQREATKKAEERKREESKKTSNTLRTTTPSTTMTKIEDENELEDSEDSEEINKQEVVSTLTNEDGTVTKTFKKSEGTEVEMKSYTYDANGVLIKKAELNADGTIKEEELIDKDEDSDENENESEDNEVEIKFVPYTDGTTIPELSSVIKAKLEQEIINNEELGTSVSKLELKIKTVDGTLKYEGIAESTEKLLGVFDVQIASDVEVDPITGQIISVNQNFWSKVLSFLSF